MLFDSFDFEENEKKGNGVCGFRFIRNGRICCEMDGKCITNVYVEDESPPLIRPIITGGEIRNERNINLNQEEEEEEIRVSSRRVEEGEDLQDCLIEPSSLSTKIDIATKTKNLQKEKEDSINISGSKRKRNKEDSECFFSPPKKKIKKE